MSTKNKIALVTGGSRGLGRNMALNLATKGIDVVLTYNRSRGEADKVVAEIEATGAKAAALQLDVADLSTYASFFSDRFLPLLKDHFDASGFDFLINNAGTGIYAPYTVKTDVAKVDEMINVHFKAGYFFTQHALDYLKSGGGIVNISSGLTRIINPGQAAYAAMKGALEVLTRYQAKELGARRIRVNIVAPGAIETDFNGGRVRDDEGVNSLIALNTALGRVGLPDDIGPVVAFLCTDDARWINAQRIEVSGGQHL